jgi:hypothetical protein
MGELFHIDGESGPIETTAGRSARPDCHEKLILPHDLCIFFVLMLWKDASPPGAPVGGRTARAALLPRQPAMRCLVECGGI